MGLNRRTRLFLGTLLLFVPFLIFVASCYPGEQPLWGQKYEELTGLGCGPESPTWRNLAGEILLYGKHSEIMPPPRKMTWSQKVFEKLFSWVPMQDCGETLTYGQALREIADSYWRINDLDEAEQYLRLAVQLETAEQLRHPEARQKIGRAELVALLKQMGNLKEAAIFQKQSVEDALRSAEKYKWDENLEAVAWTEKAKYYELLEDTKDEEACWKKLVSLHEEELSKQNLARVKAENMTAGAGVSYGLNICRWLDLLAGFYERHKDYRKQELVLLRKLASQEATFPDRDPRMGANFEAMADFYEKQENYKRAAECIMQSLRCRESPQIYERLALLYEKQKDYEAALKAMLKCVEMTEASTDKPSDGSCTVVYLRYAKMLERAGKVEEGKFWRAKAARNFRARQASLVF